MPEAPRERKFSTARCRSPSSEETLTCAWASAEISTPWEVITSGAFTEIEKTSSGRMSTVSASGRTKVPPPIWSR